MSYAAKVILDSLAPSGGRLTTFEVTCPRIILAEVNTHRVLSRNSASSRAIPIEKMIRRALDDPFTPAEWGANQPGMQAEVMLGACESKAANDVWLRARDEAMQAARALIDLGVHKQLANRLLEPFLWTTIILSATEWSNFFWQRCDRAAQPQFRQLAALMLREYHRSRPTGMQAGQWHTPYILPCEYVEFSLEERKEISVARCARVSYLNQAGTRNATIDLDLFARLKEGMHWSPFEHVAAACASRVKSGNFCGGWMQFRNYFENENRVVMTEEQRQALLLELCEDDVLMPE